MSEIQQYPVNPRLIQDEIFVTKKYYFQLWFLFLNYLRILTPETMKDIFRNDHHSIY